MPAPYPLWVAITMQSLMPTFGQPHETDFAVNEPVEWKRGWLLGRPVPVDLYRLWQATEETGKLPPEVMATVQGLIARGEALAFLTKTGRRALAFETPGYVFGTPLESWRRHMVEETEVYFKPVLKEKIIWCGWHLNEFSLDQTDTAERWMRDRASDDEIRFLVAWAHAEDRLRYSPERTFTPTPAQHEWLSLNVALPGVALAAQRAAQYRRTQR